MGMMEKILIIYSLTMMVVVAVSIYSLELSSATLCRYGVRYHWHNVCEAIEYVSLGLSILFVGGPIWTFVEANRPDKLVQLFIICMLAYSATWIAICEEALNRAHLKAEAKFEHILERKAEQNRREKFDQMVEDIELN